MNFKLPSASSRLVALLNGFNRARYSAITDQLSTDILLTRMSRIAYIVLLVKPIVIECFTHGIYEVLATVTTLELRQAEK